MKLRGTIRNEFGLFELREWAIGSPMAKSLLTALGATAVTWAGAVAVPALNDKGGMAAAISFAIVHAYRGWMLYRTDNSRA